MAADDGDEISQPGYSASVHLCEQCQNIDLGLQASDYKCWLETKQKRSWTLGTYAQVKSRNCPFCQLAGSVCFTWYNGDSFQREDPDDSTIVSVLWSTYLLRYHVQPTSLETYLGFTSSQDTSVSDLAGCFEEYIDSSLPQQWLSHCDSKHGRRCSPIVFNKKVLRMDDGSPFILRVIDVTLLCIVDAPDACRYIALSYVWGNPSDGRLVLNAKNKEILTMPNALGLVRSQIPKTIFGAITFTRDIGERYLWVDSLCLVQDDEDEILQCTLIMDAYFSMATLTIVAASGKDAHTGIPGIAQIPRQDSRVIKNVAPGVFMTAQNELDMYLRNSIYATRGWTMQEELCSPRLLVFINNQVYFRCRTETYSEETLHATKPSDQWESYSLMPNLCRHPANKQFVDFSVLIKYYAFRKFTYQSDILQAASGMIRYLSAAMQTPFIEGLPLPLERSLLFYAGHRTTTLQVTRRSTFPSYSWAGWHYVPTWLTAYSDRPSVRKKLWRHSSILKQSWIAWYAWSPNRSIRRLDTGHELRTSSTSRMNLDVINATSHKNVPKELLLLPKEVLQSQEKESIVVQYNILCFWTVALRIHLERSTFSLHGFSGDYGIRGSNGLRYGAAQLDDNTFEVGGLQEIILISEYRGFSDDEQETEDISGYFALLIHRIGDIAERRGVVKVPKDVLCWSFEPGPMWKLISLG